MFLYTSTGDEPFDQDLKDWPYQLIVAILLLKLNFVEERITWDGHPAEFNITESEV